MVSRVLRLRSWLEGTLLRSCSLRGQTPWDPERSGRVWPVTTDDKTARLLARHPFHDLEPIIADQLSEDEAGTIPQWWIDTQTSSNPVEVALRVWDSAIPGRLPRTTQIIRDSAPTITLCRATLSEDGRTAIVLAYIFGESSSL